MVKKRDYTEAHLVSDYSLLEDTTRVLGSAKVCKNSISAVADTDAKMHKNTEKRLVTEAAKRDIELSFMPSGMVRHKRNTTQIKSVPKSRFESVKYISMDNDSNNNNNDGGARKDGRNHPRHNNNRQRHRQPQFQLMFWHLDLHFGKELVKVESCAEDTTLKKILAAAMSTYKRRCRKRKRGMWSPIADDNVGQGEGEGEDGGDKEKNNEPKMLLFLQNEYSVRGGANRYTLLNQSSTLGEALKGKTVVEYPVLLVVDAAQSGEVARLSAAKFGVFEKPEAVSSSVSVSDESDGSISSEDDDDDEEEEEGEIKENENVRKRMKMTPTSENWETGRGRVGGTEMDMDIAMGKKEVRKSRFAAATPVVPVAPNVTVSGGV